MSKKRKGRKGNQSSLANRQYFQRRFLFFVIPVFWATMLGYVKNGNQFSFGSYLSQNGVYLLSLVGVYALVTWLSAKLMRKEHEKEIKAFKNDERTKQRRYKIYSFVLISLVLLGPVILLAMRQFGMTSISFSNLSGFLFLSTIVVGGVTEYILHKF